MKAAVQNCVQCFLVCSCCNNIQCFCCFLFALNTETGKPPLFCCILLSTTKLKSPSGINKVFQIWCFQSDVLAFGCCCCFFIYFGFSAVKILQKVNDSCLVKQLYLTGFYNCICNVFLWDLIGNLIKVVNYLESHYYNKRVYVSVVTSIMGNKY